MPRQEDIAIGKRIRQRRLTLKFSQGYVATAIGVQFQQLQKYETGANRVSGSRLVDLASALGVSPAYFFAEIDGLPNHSEIKSSDELDLLSSFRASSPGAQEAILRVAQQTAHASA